MRNTDKRWFKVSCTMLVILIIIGTLPLRKLYADSLTHGEYNCSPLSIVYDQNSAWGCNTQGQYTVTNNSAYNVSSWSIAITFGNSVTVTDIWNANYTTFGSSELITITSNTALTAGSTYSFGMIVTGSEEAPTAPISISLISVVTDEPEPTLTPTPTPTGVPTPTEEPTPTIEPTVTPTVTPSSVFPYGVFAAGLFNFQGWKSTLNGDVYSGSDIIYSGSELTLNGTLVTNGSITTGNNIYVRNQVTPSATITPPAWGDKIKSYSNIYEPIDSDLFSSQDSVIVEGYYYEDGDLTINATNFIGNAVIVASGNITYNVDTFECSGRLVLYSESGNITINGSNIELNGVFFAPNGNITINAYNTSVYGRLVANNVNYQGSILNLTALESDIAFLYDYPTVNISSLDDEVELGDTIVYQVYVSNNSNYTIHYKLNGESVDLSTGNSYSIVAEYSRAYTLEAFITDQAGNDILVGRASVIVTNSATPTPTPTGEPTTTPTNTPSPTTTPATPTTTPIPSTSPSPTVTPTPAITSIPTNGDVRIVLNTDYFIATDLDFFFYIYDEVPEVSGLLYGIDNVSSFSYAISSPTEEDYKTGSIDIASNWSTDDIGFFYGPTKLVLTAETLTGDTVSETFLFFCLNDLNIQPLGFDPTEDSDSDGLSDYMESIIGTESDEEDSDEDGIPDVVELFFGFTDPSDPDSDGDGISDGLEDLDEDGLNYLEQVAGTLFFNPDSDGDLLTDGDEINVYSTDPLDEDSDGDEITDYEEVMIGNNPNVPGASTVEQTTSFDISDEKIDSVDISFSSNHYLPVYVDVENLLDKSVPMTNVVGRIGAPFELTSQLDFSTATVTITYDESNLGDTLESDLGVLWYDEENKRFELQDQAIINTTNNTITLELSHFSKYAVIDRSVWELSWEETPDYYANVPSATERYDYIFMVECSYFSTAYSNRAQAVIEEFIDNMRSGERFGIGIVYDSGVTYYETLTSSKSEARSMLNTLMGYSSEATSYDVGAAVSGMKVILDSNTDVGNIPVLINVTTNTRMRYNYSLATCTGYGARVHTVILGVIDGWTHYTDDSHYNLYEELDYSFDYLMANTNGYRLHGFTPEELHEDFMLGLEEDTDEDGIPDVFEELGIRIATGELIQTDPNSDDSDGDDVSDWVEYGFDDYEKQYPFFRTLIGTLPTNNGKWYVDTCLSPAIIDNDNDGLYDNCRRYINETCDLPQDRDPETANAPEGLIDQYCNDISLGTTIATTTTSDQVNVNWPNLNINVNWSTATDSQKQQAIMEIWGRLCAWIADRDNVNAALSFVGCFSLGFYEDDLHISAHSTFEQIQRPFGYSDLYDGAFRIGTDGNIRIFKPDSFSYNDDEYIFWGWRGDYLNLGSGGELGVYYNPQRLQQHIDDNFNLFYTNYMVGVLNVVSMTGIQWWSVANYELPMRLSVYNETETGYDSILNWFPEDYQWWITGFNYHELDPHVEQMYMICEINFSDSTNLQEPHGEMIDMYTAFEDAMYISKKNEANYIIFDDVRHIAYIVWGDFDVE